MRVKTAIYVRVSRQTQDHARQVSDLTYLCEQKGWEVHSVFSEKLSRSTKIENRPEMQKLIHLANQQEINKVVVSEVSRLGSNTKEILQIIEELSRLKISIYIQNFGIETLTPNGEVNSIAQMIITILAEIARLDRENIIERTKSGQREAWEVRGKQKGRPVGTIENKSKILEKYPQVVRHLRAGKSLRDVAARSKLSVNTVRRVKAAMAD